MKTFNPHKFQATDTGCINWTGSKDNRGYAMFVNNKEAWKMSRVVYTYHFGDIEPGLFILHSCDNPACVNPDHLSAGTQRENMQQRHARNRYNTQPRGSEHARSRLSEFDIANIRKYWAAGMSQTKLGKMYGEAQPTIYNIVHGNTYSHLPITTQIDKKEICRDMYIHGATYDEICTALLISPTTVWSWTTDLSKGKK